MIRIVQAVHVLAFGLWAGVMVCAGFIVAPAAFQHLSIREAGDLVGTLLQRVAIIGYACGGLLTLSSILWVFRARLPRAIAVLAIVILMNGINGVAQLWVTPEIQPLREKIHLAEKRAAATAAETEADRLAFKKWHRRSVRLFTSNTLLGLAGLALSAGRWTRT